jgi:hypothetical protein
MLEDHFFPAFENVFSVYSNQLPQKISQGYHETFFQILTSLQFMIIFQSQSKLRTISRKEGTAFNLLKNFWKITDLEK